MSTDLYYLTLTAREVVMLGACVPIAAESIGEGAGRTPVERMSHLATFCEGLRGCAKAFPDEWGSLVTKVMALSQVVDV